MVQFTECIECKYWAYKGCQRKLIPPIKYKDCAYFVTGKIEDNDNTGPSLRD